MDSKFYSDQSGGEHFLVRVRDSKDGGLVGDISTKILGVRRPGLRTTGHQCWGELRAVAAKLAQ